MEDDAEGKQNWNDDGERVEDDAEGKQNWNDDGERGKESNWIGAQPPEPP